LEVAQNYFDTFFALEDFVISKMVDGSGKNFRQEIVYELRRKLADRILESLD